jgi:hypothetical protein
VVFELSSRGRDCFWTLTHVSNSGRRKLKESSDSSKAEVECLKEQIGRLLREVCELKQDNVRLRQLLNRFKEQINTAMNHVSEVIRSEEFMTSISSPGQPSTAVCPKAESSEWLQGVGCDVFDIDGISLDDIDQVLFWGRFALWLPTKKWATTIRTGQPNLTPLRQISQEHDFPEHHVPVIWRELQMSI